MLSQPRCNSVRYVWSGGYAEKPAFKLAGGCEQDLKQCWWRSSGDCSICFSLLVQEPRFME